jgi:hypothetical protein
VGTAGGGNRIAKTCGAPASSRTLSASKAQKRLAYATEQLKFVPDELIAACLVLIERYHAREPFVSAADVVWRSHAQELLRAHRALRTLFKQACRTRRAKPAKERQEQVAALILACEILVRDFGGWSAHFPEAKQKAKQLFAPVSKPRVLVINTYGYPIFDMYGSSAGTAPAKPD